jgi:predicted RNase H-like nuclease (RuvC/YqgF family)
MVENNTYISKNDLERCQAKSDQLENIIDMIKCSIERLENMVEKLEEECYKTTYKNIQYEYRIERLERKFKELEN